MRTMVEAPLNEALAADLDAAFPEMVRSLQNGVYTGALRMIGDPHDAEDVAQEAFLRAYRALADYPPQRIRDLRLEGWVWTIAANLCRNVHRRRSRRPATPKAEIEITDRGRGPEDAALATALGGRLSRALAELTWPMRSAVVLRHIIDLDYEEIAAALERPVGTVKADVHRGLARLRRAMEEDPNG